jgi:hypothetical protein
MLKWHATIISGIASIYLKTKNSEYLYFKQDGFGGTTNQEVPEA